MKTKRPDKEWRDLLDKKGYTRKYPYKNKKLELLKKKLLKMGGWAVVLLENENEYVDDYFSRGIKFQAKSFLKLGKPSQCHANTAELFHNSRGEIRICTGYALSDDGVWRVHSWGYSKNKIIETTEKRILYFGYILSKIESAFFRECNVLYN